MHANTHQHAQLPESRGTAGPRPLAQSAFSGETRLRELEHLAETARKVRDQAAAELTRNNGSTHHIARDRMAAAERMLRKTQQELAELRSELGSAGASSAATPAAQRKDFELAVLLGHSKARFNLDNPSQLTLQEQDFSHRSRGDSRGKEKTTTQHATWRSLMFGLLIAAGIGMGALAAYGFVTTGTLDGASQAVRDGTSHMVDRLRGLLTISALTGQDSQPAA